MWVVYAFGSALFAGLTAILAKIGLQKVDSTLATALRTIIVLVFAWSMVFLVGSQGQIGDLSARTWVFLVLSGAATGASWLCYFKALQLADVNKVTPVDKSSILLTMLLAWIFLGESFTWIKLVSFVLMGAGTYLMLDLKKGRQHTQPTSTNAWLLYAFLSAVFAALVTILGKIGIEGVESNLGTAIRTVVVLLVSWGMVALAKKGSGLRKIDKKSAGFIVISGIATGLSWLCYFKALQEGPASIVAPIDKLSIVFAVLFSYVFLKERLKLPSVLGLVVIVVGTVLLLL
jgi:transporter family protein